ncbi:hypothetical protein LguiB_012569 [Lonicera macranthoides]
MESLSQGVTIIGWPLAAEQAYNVKMLVEEMGVCMELTRGRDSVLLMEEVKRVIEQVMGENGEEIRKKACEIGELIRGVVKEGDDGVKGCSLQAMDDFVNMPYNHRKEYQKKRAKGGLREARVLWKRAPLTLVKDLDVCNDFKSSQYKPFLLLIVTIINRHNEEDIGDQVKENKPRPDLSRRNPRVSSIQIWGRREELRFGGEERTYYDLVEKIGATTIWWRR